MGSYFWPSNRLLYEDLVPSGRLTESALSSTATRSVFLSRRNAGSDEPRRSNLVGFLFARAPRKIVAMRAIVHRIFFVMTWLIVTAWVCAYIRAVKGDYQEDLLCGFFSWGIIFATLAYATRQRPVEIQTEDSDDERD
jgi:hypothetical protein